MVRTTRRKRATAPAPEHVVASECWQALPAARRIERVDLLQAWLEDDATHLRKSKRRGITMQRSLMQ